MSKPRVKLPKSTTVGEVIEIKTLLKHIMETGLRKNKEGNIIPRNIVHTFTVAFNGTEVFRTELEAGISANPYVSFSHRVAEAGEFEFTWQDDAGETYSTKKALKVA